MKATMIQRILLSLLMAITATIAAAWDFQVDGICYNKLSDGSSAEVTRDNINYFHYYGSVTIPSQVTYKGTTYSVTSIGQEAFFCCSNLTSVTIPNSVTSIGGQAFLNCTSLTSVTIPNSVTEIGGSAFAGCTGLTSVTIPKSVTKIGYCPFTSCTGLIKSAYPDHLSSPFYEFNESTFVSKFYGVAVPYPKDAIIESDGTIYSADKTTLYFVHPETTAFTIPTTVTTIGNYAFSKCSGLTSVTIPNTVTEIGSSAFWDCTGSEKVIITDIDAWCKIDFGNELSNPLNNAHHLYLGESEITDFVIPNSVTSIGNYAFCYCTGLTSLTIPNSVTSIGKQAFSDCSGLTSASIDVTSIGYQAFQDCTGLTSVTLGNSVTSIAPCAFQDCTGLKSVTIGNSVTSIGYNAFSGCDIAKVIWLPNTSPSGSSGVAAKVHYVANDQYQLSNQVVYQFLSSLFVVDGTVYVPVSPSERTCDVVDCTYLPEDKTIVIDETVSNKGIKLSVLSVNPYSFIGNSFIETLSIRHKGNVESYAFQNCTALQTATISNNGSVGEYAFQNCTALQSATISNNGSVGEYAFDGCSNMQELTLDNDGNVLNYAFQNCGSIENLTISNKGELGMFAFNGGKLKNVTITNDVTVIGSNAFNNCSALRTASIANNGYIGSSAFSGCTSLQSVNISNQGNVGGSAFIGCTSLKTALIANQGVIYKSAFSDCSAMTYATLGEKVTNIGEKAFYNCSALGEIIIPNAVTAIGVSAFERCRSLQNVSIGTGVPSLPQRVFYGCSSLATLTIPINVASIDNYAFAGSGLRDFTIEESDNIITLGSNGTSSLFADCPLDEVYIGRKLSYGTSSASGYSPFYRNTSLRTVKITDAETQIYDNEFYGCSNLQSLIIGDGVTTIGKWAFSGCSSLEYFSAGYEVESIGQEAFSDCTGLTSYYSYSAIPPTCGNLALDDINKWECTLYIPSTSADDYMAADQWKEFFFINEMEISVTKILLNCNEFIIDSTDTFQLIAEIYPNNVTDQSVMWSSSDPEVATVDENGLVTAHTIGTTTIRATAASGVYAECMVTVVARPVEEVILNKYTVKLKATESVQLTASVLPNTAEDKSIVWSVEDETIATVDQNGIVTAHTIGSTTARATASSGVYAECTITVVATPATKVVLNTYTVELKTTETSQLRATVLPKTATDKTIVWSVEDETIATVDQNGLVTARAIGTTTIKATAASGVYAKCTVTVVATPAEEVELSTYAVELQATESVQLRATVLPETATDKTIVWSVEDETIATVDQNGLVTARAVGSTTIKATAASGVYAACEITVVKTEIKVSSISLTPSSIEGSEGEQIQITATILPENATNKSIIWSSSDESIASVDASGLVSLLKNGNAVITASATDDSGVYAECAVIISENLGIEDILTDKNTFVKIFNLKGILIYEGVFSEANLNPDYYLVVLNGKNMKVKIGK